MVKDCVTRKGKLGSSRLRYSQRLCVTIESTIVLWQYQECENCMANESGLDMFPVKLIWWKTTDVVQTLGKSIIDCREFSRIATVSNSYRSFNKSWWGWSNVRQGSAKGQGISMMRPQVTYYPALRYATTAYLTLCQSGFIRPRQPSSSHSFLSTLRSPSKSHNNT